jgi:hypothetical protein
LKEPGAKTKKSSHRVKCPQCGSDKVLTPRLPGIVNALGFVLGGVGLPFLPLHRKCMSCHHDWKS